MAVRVRGEEEGGRGMGGGLPNDLPVTFRKAMAVMYDALLTYGFIALGEELFEVVDEYAESEEEWDEIWREVGSRLDTLLDSPDDEFSIYVLVEVPEETMEELLERLNEYENTQSEGFRDEANDLIRRALGKTPLQYALEIYPLIWKGEGAAGGWQHRPPSSPP